MYGLIIFIILIWIQFLAEITNLKKNQLRKLDSFSDENLG